MEAAEIIPAVPAYNADAGTGEDASRVHSRQFHPREIPGDDERIHNTTVAFDALRARGSRAIAKIHMFDITAPDGTPYREAPAFKLRATQSSPTIARA